MGNKFKFSLDKLLEMRIEKEEESKRNFTKSQREKQLVEDKLNELKNKQEMYRGINKDESLLYQKLKRNYLIALDKGIEEEEKNLFAKNKELEIRRNELVKRQIDRKTVEIIKERRKEEFMKAEERKEQELIDELALYAYLRNH